MAYQSQHGVTCRHCAASSCISMSGVISRRQLCAMLGGLPAARLLRGEQEKPSTTFSTNVKVVNVLATVRDKDGHIVSNLSKDDFVLSEDGRPQVIRYFSRET